MMSDFVTRHSNQTNVHSTTPAADPGTLVWIGDPSVVEFKDAYQFCLAHAPQIALRTDLEDALARPASNVRCVLFSSVNREPIDTASWSRLGQFYPQASKLRLLGSLCEGMHIEDEYVRGVNRLYWHRWDQVIPQWIEACGGAKPQSSLGARSVAVVASNFAAGQPLLDLADSAGVTTFWCRSAGALGIRNIDAVWWDDSVAGPTSSQQWRERIAAFDSGNRSPQHAWIVNAPRHNHHRAATEGGVDVVASKPHRIDALLDMLASQAPTEHQDTESVIGFKAA